MYIPVCVIIYSIVFLFGAMFGYAKAKDTMFEQRIDYFLYLVLLVLSLVISLVFVMLLLGYEPIILIF